MSFYCVTLAQLLKNIVCQDAYNKSLFSFKQGVEFRCKRQIAGWPATSMFSHYYLCTCPNSRDPIVMRPTTDWKTESLPRRKAADCLRVKCRTEKFVENWATHHQFAWSGALWANHEEESTGHQSVTFLTIFWMCLFIWAMFHDKDLTHN